MPKAFLHKPPIKTPKHKPARCLLNCDEDMSSAGGLEESKFIISPSIIYALLYVWALFPRVAGPASVRFHARPCVLCIMMLLLCSVYSELRLYLDNCSHEDILSPHSGTLTCLFIGFDVPEGRRTSRMWWIPADCPASTVNSRSPPDPGRSPVEYCFPGRRAQPIRQKDHAAAPKHPTIGCLFWDRRGRVPIFEEGGDVSGWSNISGGFAIGQSFVTLLWMEEFVCRPTLPLRKYLFEIFAELFVFALYRRN